MPRSPDTLLLRRYAANRDEAAFADLVRRRIDGVYSFALRRVGGDAQLAEDVTQHVFIALASQARGLIRHPDLIGWLYTTTRHRAANVVRSERRRKIREGDPSLMPDNHSAPEIDWSRVAPVLDDAIERLGAVDRTAIILRFSERRAFAEIAAMLNVSEDAARMRVDRALDKLRGWLKRRGIASSSAALSAVLTSQVIAAPPSLALTVTSAALASSATTGTLAALGGIFAMTKLKLGIAAAAVLVSVLALRDMQASRALNDEIHRLQAKHHRVAGLRVANERLANTLAQVGSTLPEAGELAALQQRIARLKARPEGVLDSAMQPVGDDANRGWATPLVAYETQLWARTSGNPDAFSPAFGWTSRNKAKINRFFARLPEHVRAAYGSSEKMLAPEPHWDGLGKLEALQILGKTEYGDSVRVHAWGRFVSGRELNLDMVFQKFDGVWRVPITDEQVDRWIASIDPTTGARITKK